MERDRFVQMYKDQMKKAIVKGGKKAQKQFEEAKRNLAEREEYLERHGLANKPKRRNQ